jgi:hypothetical protein
MTRILLISVFLFFSFAASAQFKKNDILLGGQLSYSYNSNSDSEPSGYYTSSDQKMNYGNITISLGKSLNENTIVGINLSYLPSSSTSYLGNGPPPIKYQYNGYSVGIFFRKYKSLGKDFFVFGQGSASYGWSDQTGKDSTGKKIVSGSSWNAGIELFPGIAYRISKHFFLELNIPDLFVARYTKGHSSNPYGINNEVQTSKNDNLLISTSLSSNLLTNLGLGFRLIL